jgi:lipoprotein-anchoring transpeptidase ErfK/SrfK
MMKFISVFAFTLLFGFQVSAETTRSTRSDAQPTAAARSGGGLTIEVDQSSQTMYVRGPGGFHATWKVSTGSKAKGRTPNGTWTAGALGDHRTNKTYGGKHVTLRNAIQFGNTGFYIHTGGGLGAPSSHGCVHLSSENSAKLLALARKVGHKNVKITVHA